MVFHIIRTELKISLYQEIVQMTLHSGLCKEVYISSGFFQEKGNFFASEAKDSSGKSFANNPHRKEIEITLKGVYNKTWWDSYEDFKANLLKAGYKVKAIEGRRHHSKVFLAFSNGKPLIEIIGSTNYTSTAYGINHPKGYFNNETDLVMCNDVGLEQKLKGIFDDRKFQNNIIKLEYCEDNLRTLSDEMLWIRDNLFLEG